MSSPDDEHSADDPYHQPSGEQPGHWDQPGQAPPPGYGPPGYGPPGYGQPGYGPPVYAPDHPRATTSLVLGILGVVVCQVIAPFAWVMGRKTVAEIDASHGAVGGRGAAQAGYILGIVGTVLLGLGVLLVVFYIVVVVLFVGAGLNSGMY
jgi:hypothetical protein